MAVKAIVFDYGGVVGGDFLWQKFASESPNLSKFDDLNDLLKTIREHWVRARDGGDTSGFWQAVTDIAEQPEAKIRHYFIEAARPNPRMLNLVTRLRQNYKVALLSNQIADWLGEVIKNHQLSEKFNVIVTSYECKVSKPDPKIYRFTAKTLGVKLSEIVFIDDLSRNIDAANQLGIIGVLYTDYPTLIAKLGSLGVKV